MIALKNTSSCFDNNLRHVLPSSKQFSQWYSFRQRAGLTPLSKAGGTPKPHGSREPAGLSPCLRRPRLFRHLFTAAAPISSPGPAESHRSREEWAPAWRPAPVQRWVPGSPGCGPARGPPRRATGQAEGPRDGPQRAGHPGHAQRGDTQRLHYPPRRTLAPAPRRTSARSARRLRASPRRGRRAQGRPLQGGRTRCSPGTGPGGFGGQRGGQGPGAKQQPAGSETGRPVRPGHVEQGGGSAAGAPRPVAGWPGGGAHGSRARSSRRRLPSGSGSGSAAGAPPSSWRTQRTSR